MQSSASESYPFEIYSKVEISRKARQEERLSRSKLKWMLLIDSHAELFIHLIQCIRFGIWKIWRLYRALKSFQVTRVFRVPRTQEETLIQKKTVQLKLDKLTVSEYLRTQGEKNNFLYAGLFPSDFNILVSDW